MKIPVTIYANAPLFVEADPENFGKLFASMSSDEQMLTLRAMVEAMKPHPIQWDHISFELSKPENHEVRDIFSGITQEPEE